MTRVLAEVQSMTSHPDGTEVQVKVTGPKAAPSGMKELRARAQALVSAGPASAAMKSVENITMGEIERFTEVEDAISRSDPNFVQDLIPGDFSIPQLLEMEARLYTIIVKEE